MGSIRNKPSMKSTAFSLIEVLIVVAIAGILMTLTVPAVGNLMAANNIARAGQQLNDQIALARQLASTRGQSVIVVLYKPDGTNYSALQIKGGKGFSNALTRPTVFPENFFLNPAQSPLLDEITANTTNSGTARIAGKTSAEGLFFTIRASGRVEPDLIAGTNNYLTVARWTGSEFLTNNLTTVAIDPLNGRTSLHRP